MKTSSFFTIVIFVSVVTAIIFAILFLENVGLKDNHGKTIIPENDLYCGTEWWVKLKEPVDYNIFEKFLREEIAEFGSKYDIDQREIKLEYFDDNRVKIVIEGLWSTEPGRPNFRATLEKIDFVDYVEEFPGGPIKAWCQ